MKIDSVTLTIEITRCLDCPFIWSTYTQLSEGRAINWSCRKANGRVIKQNITISLPKPEISIPTWCPLRDPQTNQ